MSYLGCVGSKPSVKARHLRHAALALVVAMQLWVPAAAAQQTPGHRQILAGHLLPDVARRPAAGDLEDDAVLHLAIGLQAKNGLAAELDHIYDPKSPQYHHFLTPQEFDRRYGASDRDYQNLIAFAQAHRLTVTAEYSDKLLLSVTGTAADVDKTFHVKLKKRRRDDGSEFYAPDREPSVDLDLKILHVSGLDDFVQQQRGAAAMPSVRVPASTDVRPVSGSAPSGALGGSDFRNAYAPGVSQTGRGQAVGLYEADGFYVKDVSSYVAEFKNELSIDVPVSVAATLDGYRSNAVQSGPPAGGCRHQSSLPPGTPAAGTPRGVKQRAKVSRFRG